MAYDLVFGVPAALFSARFWFYFYVDLHICNSQMSCLAVRFVCALFNRHRDAMAILNGFSEL